MTLEALHPHQVHLWHAFLPQDGGHALASQQLSLLTPQERQQQARFFFEKDQHRYLVTRALVRTVLSRYAPIDPADWTFEPGVHGRPAITNPHPLAQRLRFNISHTNGLVVLAITVGREIGVDTESTQRNAPLEVADRFFSEREAQAMRAMPLADQPLRFWELWTYKESYIKARGMGLALPLDRFSFGFPNPAGTTIRFEPGLVDDPGRWRFWQLKPDAHHRVAICLEHHATAQPTAFVCREAMPLRETRPLVVHAARGEIAPGLHP